tara:strand:- start:5738 stop:15217 length:9480 start_codon:yes stop_codon:yes gene_type:complete
MSVYRDYDDWKRKQDALRALENEVEEDIEEGEERPTWDSLNQDWATGEPLKWQRRKMGPGEEVTGKPKSSASYGWADSNFLTDFLGNAVWGFGETFMVPTVIDIASEASGGPDISAEYFGSQDWKDESWAGRIGYALGTGAGILTGIGAVGKGLGALSKGAGAGVKLATKQTTKKLAEEGFEAISEGAVRETIKTTRELLKKGTKSEIKSLKWWNKGPLGILNPLASARRSLVHNPLANQNINKQVAEEVTQSLSKLTKLQPGSEKLAKIVNTVMQESAESLNKHFGHSLAYSISMRTGLNTKTSQLIGDIVYEAALLGVWDTVVGETGDMAAEMYGLTEDQWGYQHWYERTMHGMKTGAILAPIRYIPGGKQVQFGHSGMVADIGTLAKLIKTRFKSAASYSNEQLKGMMNSIVISSGKTADEIFGSVRGYSKAWLAGLSQTTKTSVKDRKILEDMLKVVKSDTPGLMKTIMGEIRRDGIGSFTRASAGSFAMNYAAYKDAYDNGYLFTDEYPMDKVIADHWIGMLYMKGGKNFGRFQIKGDGVVFKGGKKEGESIFNRTKDVNKIRDIESMKEVDAFGRTPTKRFYAESGFQMEGNEISKFLKAMEKLQKNKDGLELYNRYAHLEVSEAMEKLNNEAINRSVDVKMIVDIVREKMISAKQNQELKEADFLQVANKQKDKPELDNWNVHIKNEIDRIQKEIQKENQAGNTEKAAELKKEASDLLELNLLAERISKLAGVGQSGKVITDMTKEEALAFVQGFKDLQLPNGQKLTMDTYSHLEDQVQGNTIKIAAEAEKMLVDHIWKSLKTLGLADDASIVNGRLVIHESVGDALHTLKTHVDAGAKPYYDAAQTLIGMLHAGKNTGVIEYSTNGRKYSGKDILAEGNRAEFLDLYNKNTENIHEMIYNSGPGKEANWRQKIPTWNNKDGFLDPQMLAAVPLWHSIQSAHRYRRNEQAYFSFTGAEGGTREAKLLFSFLKNKLGGNVSFRIIEKLTDGSLKEIDLSGKDKDLNAFYNQLNRTLELLNLDSSGKVSRKEIDVGELTAIKDEITKNIGNVLTNPQEFNSFLQFVSQRFVRELTGNPNISTSLKQIVIMALHKDSLVAIKRDGALNLRSAQALRDTLLSDPSIIKNSSEYTRLENLINEYESKVENPLRSALNKKGNAINFVDAKLDVNIDPLMRNDFIQEVSEMINRADRIAHVDLIDLHGKAQELGVSVAEIRALVDKQNEAAINEGKVINETLENEMVKLARDAANLDQIFTLLVQNRDHIGLRSFIDSSQKLSELTNLMFTNKGITPESIKNWRKQMQEYVIEAMSERNETLRIDSILDVDNYIQNQVNSLSLVDRSNRPHSGNTSISKQQYETKWNLTTDFIDNLIYNPRKILDSFGIKNPPIGTREYAVIEKGLQKVIDGTFTVKDYVDVVIEPIIKAQKVKIDTILKSQIKDKKLPGTYEDFVLDTYHVVQAALASKKMPIGIYENGRLTIDNTTTSNWNRGLNLLAETLGLNTDMGTMILLGGRYGTGKGFTSKMTPEARLELEQKLADGAFVDINSKELLKTGDAELIDLYQNLQKTSVGKDGSTQFMFIQLDEKTSILMPTIVKPRILENFRDPQSKLRKDLVALFRSHNPKKSDYDLNLMVQDYIKKHVPNAEFNKQGVMTPLDLKNSEAINLVQIARLMHAKGFDLMKVAKGESTIVEQLQALKYIKLDNSRSGLSLSDRALHFTREYLPRFLDKNSKMWEAYDIFANHMFDSQGKTKPRRDLQFFDEKGDSKGFFNSSNISREVLKEQLKRNNPNMSRRERNEFIENILKHHDKLAASVMNGSKFLSMPEMISELVAKGATREWFIWGDKVNDKGDVIGEKIIGFNVAIKPIEYHHKINNETGAIEVHIGKTAYAWHPVMDKIMQNRNGEYMVDAIGFESSHKEHRRYNPQTGLIESPGVDIGSFKPMRGTDWMTFENLRDVGIFTNAPWGPAVSRKIQTRGGMAVETMDNIFLVDRESIFIKSISGTHDATMSAGFANLLSNQSLKDLNSITKIHDTTADMVQRFAAMAAESNPFSYKEITSKLLMGQKETGDQIGKVTGVEAVLAVDGLPLFEFMAPNIDKMVTSEYMGNRNLITSAVKNGSYSVMQPAGGLSMPVRYEGVQYSFGGSGMSGKEWTTPLDHFMMTRDSGTGSVAFQPNKNESLTFIFKVTKDFVKENKLERLGKDIEGNDFAVSLNPDGTLTVIGQHLSTKIAIKENANAINRLEKALEADMKSLIEWIKIDEGITTVGDLAMMLNGTRSEYKNEFTEYILDSHLNGKNNPDAAYNLLASGRKDKKHMYSQIHLGKVDLRQPKAGINDWVITRVEKLLDKRRGPVSEMNLLDVIDPQDADFDLDKSASMFTLPGRVIKEMYNVSGYQQSTDALFERALIEVGLDRNQGQYTDTIKFLDAKRGSLIRQVSVLSTMLQYYSVREGDIFLPGWQKGGKNRTDRFQIGPELGFQVNDIKGVRYKIALKDGMELVQSLEYMKRLIKATIDIYKKPQDIRDIQLDKLIWENKDLGFLEIWQYQGIQDKVGKKVSFDAMSTEGQLIHKKIRQGIIQPLGELHNLNLMMDHFTDGTSRKMSAFEMVNRYENILNTIKMTGYRWDKDSGKLVGNELRSTVDPLLHFLGDNHFNSSNTAARSELPIIVALSSLRKQLNSNIFKNGIPSIDDGLGQILAGITKATPDNVNKAINGILNDQTKILTVSTIKYKLDQVNDVLKDLVSRGKEDTAVYRYWKSEGDKYNAIILEFNKQVNDPNTIYHMHKPEKYDSKKPRVYKNDTIGIFRLVGKGDKKRAEQMMLFKPGEKVTWRAGDVIVKNPKRLEMGFDNTARVRRAMHNAFARLDRRVDKVDEFRLNELVERFNEALNARENQVIDPSRPKDAARFGLAAEKDLQILMDYIDMARDLGGPYGTIMQQQFIHMLLTPRADRNVFHIVGNDLRKSSSLTPKFNSNKRNESLVFQFLQRAMDGQGSRVIDSATAKDWYQTINDRFKKAFIREYDPSLKGDVFAFERITREMSDFRLLPPMKEMPSFMTDVNLNKDAVKIASDYLMGSYFLDPFELYRTTVDMTVTSLDGAPPAHIVTNVVNKMWGSINDYSFKGGNIFEPLHTYRSKIYHGTEAGKGDVMDYFRELDRSCW